MKRLFVCIMASAVLLSGCTGQTTMEANKGIDCVSTIKTNAGDYEKTNMKVILGSQPKGDRTETARKIVTLYKENGFASTYFCSESDELRVSVYQDRDSNSPLFVFSYYTEDERISFE